IMNQVLPAGKVFQAGTLSGNPLAVAAGAATLAELKEHPPYDSLESHGKLLEEGFSSAATKAAIPCQIARVGSMMTLFFQANSFPDGPRRVTGWKTASKSNTEHYAKFFWGMIEQGIYLPCSQFEALFFSMMHTDQDIHRTVAAAEQVLLGLASEN
ncbi:MAG: aspartate aminotransferase family protein, partial [Pirellulales bacterium]|nr:aspartate aminotransferase family protein [Pirellulales bacterium]